MAKWGGFGGEGGERRRFSRSRLRADHEFNYIIENACNEIERKKSMTNEWHQTHRPPKFGIFPIMARVLLALIAPMGNVWADGEQAKDSAALAKASQNPVSSLISVPFQNDATFNNGPEDAFVNVLTIKPVVPMGITGNWNLINRGIIPVVYQSEAYQGQTTIGGATISGGTTEFVRPGQALGSEFGLGDIVYQGFFTPAKSSKVIWGIGPQLNLPTGTGRMSSDQWSLGPAAVVLTMPGRWVIGILASNVWNIGNGYNDAPDVNALTAQYFINYNLKGGWYVSSAPTITANWEAEGDNTWTVPFGGGGGRVFKIGKQAVKMSGAIYYSAIRPDDASDWDLQFAMTFMFPK